MASTNLGVSTLLQHTPTFCYTTFFLCILFLRVMFFRFYIQVYCPTIHNTLWVSFSVSTKTCCSTHITRLTQFRHDPASHHPPLPMSTSLHCWSEPGSACLQNGTPPFSPLYLHMMRGNACRFYHVYTLCTNTYTIDERKVCRLCVCIAERIARVSHA